MMLIGTDLIIESSLMRSSLSLRIPRERQWEKKIATYREIKGDPWRWAQVQPPDDIAIIQRWISAVYPAYVSREAGEASEEDPEVINLGGLL